MKPGAQVTMPGRNQGAIDAARHAAAIIATEGKPQGNLDAAHVAFGTLKSITDQFPGEP